jgi:YVTN family beta-propeller protein
VIDGQNCNVLATVPVGNGPSALCAPSFIGKVYCANTNSNTVSAIGLESLTVARTFSVGTRPVAFVEVPRLFVMVVNTGSNDVSVIDVINDTVINTYAVGTSPVAAACYAGGPFQRLVYVANSASDDVTVIDPILDSVVATIPVGDMPVALAVDSFNGKVYCANELDDNVSVIDCSTNTVVATFPANYTPVALLNTPYGRTYVANTNGSSVTVIADSSAVGIAENLQLTANSLRLTASVISGNLFLPPGPAANRRLPIACLLDAAGRRVLALKPGTNDVRSLAPGVYFAREAQAQAQAQAVRKVVIAR